MKLRTESELVQIALDGAPHDPDKAEDVLRFFCEAVERGDVPEGTVLEYLSRCFRKIIDDIDGKKPLKPSHALNLTHAKGQRRGRTLEKVAEVDLSLALAVVRCMNAGLSRVAAIEKVANESKPAASPAKVRTAYQNYGQHAKDLTK